MKKLLLAISLIFATSAAMAQSPENYNGASISYVGNSFIGDGDSVEAPSGFGVNYVHGFAIAGQTPLFLETGASLSLGLQDENHVASTMLDLQVPLNLVYSLPVGNSMSLNPYAGLNARWYIIGSSKPDGGDAINMFDKDLLGDAALNPLYLGWQVGANFNYSKYWVGFSYGTTFTEVMKKSDVYASRFTVSVGFRF